MAFGIKYIQGTEQEKAKDLKAIVDKDEADNGGSVPARSPSQSQKASPAPARSSEVLQSPSAGRGTSSFRPKRKSQQNDTEDNPWDAYNDAEENDEAEEQNKSTPPPKFGPTPQELLGWRARRLVQDVGEFKKWPLNELMAQEHRALREPEAVIAEFLPVYEQLIRPIREQGARSLNEALQKHPNEVVFLLVKGEAQKLRVLVSENAGAQKLLHGAVVESLPASATQFAPPIQIFDAAAVAPAAPAPTTKHKP